MTSPTWVRSSARQRGAALLGVLLVCILLSAIAFEVAVRRQGMARDLRLRLDAAQASAAAEAGLTVMAARLSRDGAEGLCERSRREDLASGIAATTTESLGLEGLSVVLDIRDPGRVIDLNRASVSAIDAKLRAAGLSPAVTQEAADAVSSYRRTDGMGDAGAARIGLRRRATWERDAIAFDDPDELGRVPGLPPTAFRQLAPIATAHDHGRCTPGGSRAVTATATAEVGGVRASREAVFKLDAATGAISSLRLSVPADPLPRPVP